MATSFPGITLLLSYYIGLCALVNNFFEQFGSGGSRKDGGLGCAATAGESGYDRCKDAERSGEAEGFGEPMGPMGPIGHGPMGQN